MCDVAGNEPCIVIEGDEYLKYCRYCITRWTSAVMIDKTVCVRKMRYYISLHNAHKLELLTYDHENITEVLHHHDCPCPSPQTSDSTTEKNLISVCLKMLNKRMLKLLMFYLITKLEHNWSVYTIKNINSKPTTHGDCSSIKSLCNFLDITTYSPRGRKQ